MKGITMQNHIQWTRPNNDEQWDRILWKALGWLAFHSPLLYCQKIDCVPRSLFRGLKKKIESRNHNSFSIITLLLQVFITTRTCDNINYNYVEVPNQQTQISMDFGLPYVVQKLREVVFQQVSTKIKIKSSKRSR